ncbi:MAG TPA: 5'-methylthioadenosine/S-adenosylhomocysteine nucleosidase [Syntrophales bacterium]|nr:5'-methylthioadenosine/S-adenosylhomocysteine nucleosidase [Syntrophales bacterium]
MSSDPVIGLVIATMLEAEPFIKGLALMECERNPFPIYGRPSRPMETSHEHQNMSPHRLSGDHPHPSLPHQEGGKKGGGSFQGKDGIYLIISGIGKANAAMACTYFIDRYHPACICNLGAAGSVNASYSLGECYHITNIIEPDRPELKTGIPHTHTPYFLDNFATAVLATQDRAVRDPAERDRIGRDAQLVDMEGGSITQACRHFGVKCFLFKFVSDTPDHRKSDDIERNIALCRDSFFQFFRDTVLPCLK